MARRLLLAMLALLALVIAGTAVAQERPSTAGALTVEGRKLQPAGRMTQLGAFPTGGALTPDGRFYWAVDAGRGANYIRVIDTATGEVKKALPLPGGYVGIAFAPSGEAAYVSGVTSDGTPPPGSKGTGGDVIHVYDVNPRTGNAVERDPIALPNARDGAAAGDELPPASNVLAWPEGMDVMPDGKHLVVALGQADQVAIVDLGTHAVSLADVGRYPYGVVADPHRARAYVTNERDGTVSVVDVPSGHLAATIGVGAGRDQYAHPEGLSADPQEDRVYVAVTDRDRVAVIDTRHLRLERYLDVSRSSIGGTAPVTTAVAPDADTLYVADAGEDAVAAFTLTRRPSASAARRRRVVKVKGTRSIARYRAGKARARRRLRRAGRAKLRRYSRTLQRLDRRYLRGRVVRSCRGPMRRGERRWVRAVLRAQARLAKDRNRARRRHGGARKRARTRAARRYSRAIARARKRVALGCPRPGFLPGAPPFKLLGRVPTAAYTTDVEVTPHGGSLVWLSARGVGTGPSAPGGQSPGRLVLGRAGVVSRPTDKELVAYTDRADRQLIPSNFTGPPAGTPVVGPNGGPSEKIKHVFYVVKENRTYDQIFGSEPRGRGDPRFEMFDDNGVPGPTGGVTPNAHALARKFPLLDSVYANSEESTLGHKITAGGYANDYTQRYVATHGGRKGNPDIFPIGYPPNAFVFDQAVRQGLPFRVYGELGAGNQPFGDDGRPTYQGVLTNTDPAYPSQVQQICAPANQNPPLPNSARCTADAGTVTTGTHTTSGAPAAQSRIRTFAGEFQAQAAAGAVPAFNYLILFNNHTDGTTAGAYTPKADIADNDLALGQLVELVSNSSIWDSSAIFVVEDDSQAGIDSVDAHRIPALVISPWAKRGTVISTRYDHYSFLRTAEMIVGLRPLSINDALATPLYDAFISGNEQPDVNGTRYLAVQPEQSLTETNSASAAGAKLSAALPWDRTDYVPQPLSDEILWHSVFGESSQPPPVGPGASPIEQARARGALSRYRSGRSARRWLLRHSSGERENELRSKSLVKLLSAGR
jgi:YVTN family beta-propeller protein